MFGLSAFLERLRLEGCADILFHTIPLAYWYKAQQFCVDIIMFSAFIWILKSFPGPDDCSITLPHSSVSKAAKFVDGFKNIHFSFITI